MKATQQLHELGQSIWLDDISRKLLDSGTLERYISEFSVTGLTSNPSIFAKAIKDHVRANGGLFNNWNPKIVQFVSPQVWASRASRAYTLAENHNLLLSIFPFEKAWYAQRVPGLWVEFVGHPMIGRSPTPNAQRPKSVTAPCVLLLPGSRKDEIRRHLPVLYDAATLLKKQIPGLRVVMVLPDEKLKQMVDMYCWFGMGGQASLQTSKDETPTLVKIQTQVGDLSEALAQADLAITKSGTVTMECALHGVPAVVFYKTSWPTYFIGKQIVTVKYLAMPNLIADEAIYPEFVQQTATPKNIAAAALQLLRDEKRRAVVQGKLAGVIASLGKPGAPERAAETILSLLP